ncbi:MAG: type II toxin-antitoxin system RelE/ParE family toxin [Acidimicrobiales bacterium]
MARPSWSVDFHPECEAWATQLNQSDAEALLAAVRVLRDEGPSLGRPLVDTIKGSRHPNMKELRPGSTGRTEIRVLFAFDRGRRAILLVGGDKSDDWTGWYRTNIPIADDRFDQHHAKTDPERTTSDPRKTIRKRGPKGKQR